MQYIADGLEYLASVEARKRGGSLGREAFPAFGGSPPEGVHRAGSMSPRNETPLRRHAEKKWRGEERALGRTVLSCYSASESSNSIPGNQDGPSAPVGNCPTVATLIPCTEPPGELHELAHRRLLQASVVLNTTKLESGRPAKRETVLGRTNAQACLQDDIRNCCFAPEVLEFAQQRKFDYFRELMIEFHELKNDIHTVLHP